MNVNPENSTISWAAAKRSTQVVFLVCGIALSSWAPMVPFVKDKLQLSDSGLGILLLFLGAGGICVMPITDRLIRRLGIRKVILTATLMICISLPLILQLRSPWSAATMLFVFGAGIGMLDVGMNSHGTLVQKKSPAPIMSSLHGLYSVGGLIGPVLVGTLMNAGLVPYASILLVSICLAIISISQYRALINRRTEQSIISSTHTNDAIQTQIRPWTYGPVLFVGMMCFIAFSSEGAVLDWGALLLRDSKNVEGEYAGIGFACFSVAMAVMRLLGDRIVSKVDSKAIVLYGSIIAFAGFTIAILAPGLFTSLIGFALIGVGAANIVPVFFTAAGNLPNVSSSSAIAVMATIGYAGMLAGPAILGFIAERLSLPAALFVAGALLLVSGVLYRFYSFPPHNQPAQTR
jgi:fucose permease